MADITNQTSGLKVLADGTLVHSGETVTVAEFDASHPVHKAWLKSGEISVAKAKPATKASTDKSAAEKEAAKAEVKAAQPANAAAEKAMLADGSGADEAKAFEDAEKRLETAKAALA